MTAIELIAYRRECRMIETELQVMAMTVAGTLQVNDDQRPEPYTMLEFTGEVN